MLLSTAPLGAAAHSARRARSQRAQCRSAGATRIRAALQEGRQRRSRKDDEEEGDGISLFGRKITLRVEDEPKQGSRERQRYYDDDYEDDRPPRRAPPPRQEEKPSGSPFDGLLNAFKGKEEKEFDSYAPPRSEERQGRRTASSRPARPAYDDDFDDEPPARNGNGASNGGGFLGGLAALSKAPEALANMAEELSFKRKEEEVRREPRRESSGSGSRERRRLVRRDDPEDDYYDERPLAKEEKGRGPFSINRRTAIAACVCCGGAAVGLGYFGTGAYQKNIAMSMAIDMVAYEDALAERKKYLFQNLAGSETVLEVGVGTGPNMTFYPASVDEVIGLDTNEYMRPYAEVRGQRAGKAFKFVKGAAEDMESIPDSSVDAVVSTIALCCVGDPKAALSEISRVLRPGGAFLFIEHVAADAAKDPFLALAQRVVDPFQQVAAGGCHLTRDTGGLIRSVSRMVETPEGMARWGPPPRSFLRDMGKRPAFLFDRVMIEDFTVPGMNLIAPHVSGIAFKPELDFL